MKETSVQSVFSADFLCEIANKFVKQEMYEEAHRVLVDACRLYPNHLTLRIQLNRVRDIQRQSSNSTVLSPKAQTLRQQQDSQANTLIGIGELYKRQEQPTKAINAFKQAIQLNPYNFLPYFSLGMLYFQRREYKHAVELLTRAKALNPFYEDVSQHLALAYFHLELYHEAMLHMVDAFLLSGDLDKREDSPYQQKLRLLMNRTDGFTREKRNELIKERQKKLRQLFENTDKQLHKTNGNTSTVKPMAMINKQSLSQKERSLATKLKKFFILRNLDDPTIVKIALFSRELTKAAKDYVYQENTAVLGLLLVEDGTIAITKESAYRAIELLTVSKGGFFGDDVLLFAPHYQTSAVVTSKKAQIILIDRSPLLELFGRDSKIALHFYWYLWKSLIFHIRQANEQLKDLFNEQIQQFQLEVNRRGDPPQELRIHLQDLTLLLQHGVEEFYNQGEYIFRENETGDKFYIVLEGGVIICKDIEGVGEETLATLSHGDVFGEMSLISTENRNANAKAYQPGTMVLAIKRNILQEVLNMPAGNACEFLLLLYRFLYRRLWEIREKIYHWTIMAAQP